MKKILRLSALLLTSFFLMHGLNSSAVAAALPKGTLLTIDNGFNGKVSYFTMAVSTAGLTTTNLRSTKTDGTQNPNSTDGGILLLTAQPASTLPAPPGTTGLSGSHDGGPNYTYDFGPIDRPWSFFGNTGDHFQSTATISADPVAGTIDMTGWTVTWNGIAAINMGTGPLGSFTVSGSNYTVGYAATVPEGDNSGFGGVPYALHLEGRIVPAAIPEPASLLLIGSGLLGLLALAKRK